MAEQTSQEPTMEEILASIRRIISEDEAPASDVKEASPEGDAGPPPDETQAAAAPEPEAAPAAEPAQPAPQPTPQPVSAVPSPPASAAVAEEEEEEDDEPLELTEKVETVGDLDVYTPSEPPPRPVAEPPATPPGEMLVSARAAEAAASAFGKLSQVVAMPAEGRTLEDVVRELLRPLLQQWLDDHLPAIVQEAVQAEVERIARTRVR